MNTTNTITFLENTYAGANVERIYCNEMDFVKRLEAKLPTYEVILENKLQKFYCDVDIYIGTENYNPKVGDTIVSKSKQFLLQMFSSTFPDVTPNLCVKTSHASTVYEGRQIFYSYYRKQYLMFQTN